MSGRNALKTDGYACPDCLYGPSPFGSTTFSLGGQPERGSGFRWNYHAAAAAPIFGGALPTIDQCARCDGTGRVVERRTIRERRSGGDRRGE